MHNKPSTKKWKQLINNSIVNCPKCGKKISFENYDKNNDEGWIINNENKIICLRCYLQNK